MNEFSSVKFHKLLRRPQRKIILAFAIVFISFFTVSTILESMVSHPEPMLGRAKRQYWFKEPPLAEYNEDTTILDYEYVD